MEITAANNPKVDMRVVEQFNAVESQVPEHLRMKPGEYNLAIPYDPDQIFQQHARRSLNCQ